MEPTMASAITWALTGLVFGLGASRYNKDKFRQGLARCVFMVLFNLTAWFIINVGF